MAEDLGEEETEDGLRMHDCQCGLNAGSWRKTISLLIDELETVAEVSTVEVPDRGTTRSVSWGTLREKFVRCSVCAAGKGCRKGPDRSITFARSNQRSERPKALFDAVKMNGVRGGRGLGGRGLGESWKRSQYKQ